MSASVIQSMYAAMKSVDLPALSAAFSEDVVAIEPAGLAYGGTRTSRNALFEDVFGYLLQRVSFKLESSEVFGSGDRLAGHFTATLTGLSSGETISLDQVELYEVANGVIIKVEVFQNNTPELIAFFDRNGPPL